MLESIAVNPTVNGMVWQPISVGFSRYRANMAKTLTKTVLWQNVLALMEGAYGRENLTRLASETKIGPGSATRIKVQETSVGIDVLEKLADRFKLEPWQLLAPRMGAGLYRIETENSQHQPAGAQLAPVLRPPRERFNFVARTEEERLRLAKRREANKKKGK